MKAGTLALTKTLANELGATQRKMESSMLGIITQDRISNEAIRQKNKWVILQIDLLSDGRGEYCNCDEELTTGVRDIIYKLDR